MKKLLWAWALPLAMFLQPGCKKLNKLLTFNISYQDTESVPPNTFIGVPLSFITGNISASDTSQFQTYNTAPGLIRHAYLKGMTLTILNPPGQTFNFVQSVSISLYTPSLGSTRIAYLDSIPASSGNQLTLMTTNVDIQNYIKLDSFAIETGVVATQTTSQTISIAINSEFQVNASPF
ncbi:MAG TPA: hypothetical protein VMV20_08180 [Chitinophagaceae bacterium]|nr:hypothetical protein [Chitinophagaceae bacterium]